MQCEASSQLQEPIERSLLPRLMFVDDDPLLRLIAQERLSAEGFPLSVEADGHDAFVTIQNEQPDLILLDLEMPKVDGFQVLDSLRSDDRLRHIPVIVITGREDSPAIERAFESGADSFVIKPINWPALMHHIRFVHRSALNESRLAENVSRLRQTTAELERTTQDLKVALGKAAETSAAKSRFLASISHELRTPLNAIIGFSEIVSNCPELARSPRNLDYLGDVKRSGIKLLQLVNNIIDIAKLDMGNLSLSRSPTDLNALLQEAMRRSKPAEPCHVEVDIEDNPLPIALVDEKRLRQAIENILENAFKFTRPGGAVGLRARHEGGRVIIEILDTGIGMESAAIPHALEPFAQIDGSLSRRFEGIGLGLPLAKKFVELHGGSLTVASEQGVGTTVTIQVACEA